MTCCILAVDDEPALLDIVALALEAFPCRIELASNGIEGLRKVKEVKPDLVLLDIMMPGMDGWQALEHIRQLTNVPVIMLSALASDSDVARAMSLGANDYLIKPITIMTLRTRAKKLLPRH